MIRSLAILLLALAGAGALQAQGTWRGIRVAPESRCAPYDRDDYPYSQSIELRIIEQMGGGGICSPYTGECFTSRRQTDIEHIIALSEAHDSGLCAADAETRRAFASDLRNLTLASPELNRFEKRAKDAADWLPPQNRCWFAGRIIAVRRAYALSIDRREANALERVLAGCEAVVDLMTTPVHLVGPGMVNARACADTTCDIVTTFSSGQPLDMLEEVEGGAWNNDTRWLKVRHENGEVFVHASLIRLATPTPKPTPTPRSTSTPRANGSTTVNPNQATSRYYVVAPDSANARSCPRTNCSVVTSFTRGAEVAVLQQVSGQSVGGDSTWQAVKHGSRVVFVHGPLLSRNRPAPISTPVRQVSSSQGQTSAQPSTDPGPQFSCDCSKSCGAMASCEEALFQLRQCGCSRRDSDGDGVPCESICPGG